jgi:glutathione synthase/RimK-type ligase-like ATP-grasp enzyme
MIIGIHPDQTGQQSFSEKWTEFLETRGVQVRELDLLGCDALQQAGQCDGVMCRWLHDPNHKQSLKQILYTIEHHLGVPVFPDSATSWHYDEKTAQTYLLESLGAPVPQTWVFWNRDEALQWAREAPYPVVFKLSAGASSCNVVKASSEREARPLIERMFRRGIFPMTMHRPGELRARLRGVLDMGHRAADAVRYVRTGQFPTLKSRWWKPEFGYAYFQEFLPNNEYDTRVTVIGDRAFGFRRKNRPNDFRASGSGTLLMDPEGVDQRCVELAFEISKRGGFQSMAYDFLFKNGSPVVGEVSYTFADTAVQQCPGHWDSDMRWHEGQMWPEEAQVSDFVTRIGRMRGGEGEPQMARMGADGERQGGRGRG